MWTPLTGAVGEDTTMGVVSVISVADHVVEDNVLAVLVHHDHVTGATAHSAKLIV